MVKKEFGEYYLGLDIGTNSVGWAVTDPQYNILRFNGKAMWGIHLFEEGKTAEERRQHRIARRRLERRNQRIALLQNLFDEEICKIDSGFFMRVKESSYVMADRKTKQPNSIFNDPAFKDKDYHKKYPTVYHLRKDLMTTDEKPDLRLIYLAAHHIVKNRGHFLYEGISDGNIPKFDVVFNELLSSLESEMGVRFEVNENLDAIRSTLLSRDLTISDKKKRLSGLLSVTGSQEKAIIALLSGGTQKITPLFWVDSDSNLSKKELDELGSISLKDTSLDDNRVNLESVLGGNLVNVLDLMKAVYDWGLLASMLNNHSTLSDAKVEEYETHARDLRLLKKVLVSYAKKHGNDYSACRQVFKSSEYGNYVSYSGKVKGTKGGDAVKFCTQVDFCDYVRKKLKTLDIDLTQDDELREMEIRLENKTFMPKQRSRENSVIPNVLHKNELEKILANASRFYPFLSEKDGTGWSVSQKIVSLCTFRIPYYVGPLNENSSNAWAEHKKKGSVYPWNFEDMIDIDKSSEHFIERLISRCTYLVSEKVLPKGSLLYQRFMLYNEINSISVNGERIRPDMKRALIDELFVKKGGTVSKKKIVEFITSRTGETDILITGVDEKVASSLKLERQMSNILGDAVKDHKLVEEIIRTATIFGDDRRRLKAKLNSAYSGKLTKGQIDGIASIKFSDWGRLSERFLTGVRASLPDGREMNIITALEQTNLNLMELLSDKLGFKKKVDEINMSMTGAQYGPITYELVDDLYCSPAVKHSIWRVLSVIKDIVKITGHDPKKVFIETTREARADGRKISRRDDLLSKYKAMADSESYREIISSLESSDNARLRSKKLYAYYCQNGRCMYCGKKIELNDIGNSEIYDIDHIYPQSKVTDDSITNTVLTCRAHNSMKSDIFPIAKDIQSKMGGFWKHLMESKLISEEKYRRLIRRDGFSEDELSRFISRQLVETSQSVKAVAEIMRKVFHGDTDIVYVKGGNVSKFRNDFKDRGLYIKSRNVNDLHHAKDAYLNIVVGNVYDTKFTKNPMSVIRSESYNLGKIFEKDVSRNGMIAWKAGEDGTIAVVDKYMRRDNVLFTRAPFKRTGQLYNLTILKKGKGKHPIKKGMDPGKYGGYDSVAGSFFSLVEYSEKGKRKRSVEYVPIIDSKEVMESDNVNGYFEKRGFKEPDVRLRCIKMDTLFEMDGLKYHITGRTGDSLVFKVAEQLILPKEQYNYCKRIYKYCDDKKDRRVKIAPEDYQITRDDNAELYDVLSKKLDDRFSSAISLGSICSIVKEGSEVFRVLATDSQVECLNNILMILHCSPSVVGLDMIGGPSKCGAIRRSKVIGPKESIRIISQSPSGLFENFIDLSKI